MCPEITPDFTEALEAIPEGEYAARVTEVEVKTSGDKSKNPGSKYLNWKLETFGKNDDKLNGRTIYHTTPLSGKGAGILKAFFKAVGVDTSGSLDTDIIMGRELVVVLKYQDPDDAFPRVKTVKSYDSSAAV